jgi:hypothetical protein
MALEPKGKGKRDTTIEQMFTSDLRGRQSVRATFKLSESCISAISIVATHLGIKQKSLFDHLIEDTQSLHSIAQEMRNVKIVTHGRVQKTFVISRKTLSALDQIAKSFNAPRDALVEYSVQRLLPVIMREQKKHTQRKRILRDITDHIIEGKGILDRIRTSLGEEDPIYSRFETAMNHLENAFNHINTYIDRGQIIESFDPEAMQELLTAKRRRRRLGS